MNITTATETRAAGIRAALAQFTGTSIWYRHPLFRGFLTTEGVQYLANNADAHWLIDTIALLQLAEASVREEPFQVWTLKVETDQSAVLTCTDGNDGLVFCSEISWTDFPLDEIDLWYANSTLYLPSEH